VAEDTARGRKQAFVAIVAGIAAMLGLAGLVLWRRGHRARVEAEQRTSEYDVPPPETTAEAAPPVVAPPASAPKKPGKICPTCGGRYTSDDSFCGKDGTTLVLLN
jgi:LPXTG-motif cell wall-anchored protein